MLWPALRDEAKRAGGERPLEAVRAGEPGAAAEIDRLVRSFARRLARPGRGPGAEFDWEDVAQEASHRLLAAGIRQYRGAGSERSYVFAVVKATVLQMARTAARRRRREEAVATKARAPYPDPTRSLDVRNILAALEEDCRQLIERVVFRDEGYSALAQELQITPSAVRSRLHRCLGRARQIATGMDA